MSDYLVFGAYGGIGSNLSRRLARDGNRLFLAGRDEKKLQPLAEEIGAPHCVTDAGSSSQIEACVQEAEERFGQIHGIVNCIGSLLLKPAHLTTDSEFDSVITTNLSSSFAIVRAGVKAMMKGGGSIVLITSAAARIGIANHEAIAAAKGGIIGLTISAAATYGARGIRVNCVAPGLVKTPMTSKITANETALKSSSAMHVLGRVGEPDDIASMIEWLLQPDQTWVTGQVFGVDGGLGTIRTRSG
jgi:NAD(P)-dependent dehydrogenase (short-subunit alcohol dehydrogenase family)